MAAASRSASSRPPATAKTAPPLPVRYQSTPATTCRARPQRVREGGVGAARGRLESAPHQFRCRAPDRRRGAAPAAQSGRRRGSRLVQRPRTCRPWNSVWWTRSRDGASGSASASRRSPRPRTRCADSESSAGTSLPTPSAASGDAIRVDDHAEFREPGDPGAKHSRGVGRSATEPRAVGHDLRQPYAHRQGPARERAQCLGGADGQVALAGRHPGGGRSIDRQGQRVGVRGLHAEADQIVPVDGHQDAVDVMPAVGAARDDRQREIELCVCGDDPRGEARHSR